MPLVATILCSLSDGAIRDALSTAPLSQKTLVGVLLPKRQAAVSSEQPHVRIPRPLPLPQRSQRLGRGPSHSHPTVISSRPPATHHAPSTPNHLRIRTLTVSLRSSSYAMRAQTRRVLERLACAHANASFIVTWLEELLSAHTAWALSQGALLVRVLAQLAESAPAAVEPHGTAILRAVRPVLRAEVAALRQAAMAGAFGGGASGGGAAGSGAIGPSSATDGEQPERSGLLPAVLLCVPHLWLRSADEDEAGDFAAIARLVCADDREVSQTAFYCLQTLLGLQCRRLTLPLLSALGRMLLTCDGARPGQLLRALNLSSLLARGRAEALIADADAAHVADGVDISAGDHDGNDSGGGDGAGDGSGAGSAPHVVTMIAAWDQLRSVFEAVAMTWVGHSLPEVTMQALGLLATVDTPAAVRRFPPRDRPALRSLLAGARHAATQASARSHAAAPHACSKGSDVTSTDGAAPAVDTAMEPAVEPAAVPAAPPAEESSEGARGALGPLYAPWHAVDVWKVVAEHYDRFFPSIALAWSGAPAQSAQCRAQTRATREARRAHNAGTGKERQLRMNFAPACVHRGESCTWSPQEFLHERS